MVGAFPRSSDAFALLGSVEFASERFTDAVETYSKALELNPDSGDAMLNWPRHKPPQAPQIKPGKRGEAMRRFPGRAVFELELARLLVREREREARLSKPARKPCSGLRRSTIRISPKCNTNWESSLYAADKLRQQRRTLKTR